MADFQKIRARAAKRKGGEVVLTSLLGPLPDNAAVAKITDDRILSTMAERVFAAGFVWRVIEQKRSCISSRSDCCSSPTISGTN